jgi:SAM-dependent methyltransferase
VNTGEAVENMHEYLAQVRSEIDDEVRRRRAAGDFPLSFERKLDELFARFTPTGTADDHFTETLKLADRASYFDIRVPIGSRKTLKGATRYALWQAEAWFLNYVVTQLNHFSASAMRVVHLLDERVTDLEREVATMAAPALSDGPAARSADPLPYLALLTSRLGGAEEGPTRVSGRVLHAECGDGALMSALELAGTDVYGIDPGSDAADQAARLGLDVRRDDVLGHLGSLATETLGGIVLSGVVDRSKTAEHLRMLELAEQVLVPGGVLAVLGIARDAWESTVGPVVADLAPGRPMSPATWVHLMGRAGLTVLEVQEEQGSFAVLAEKPSATR